jgi:hypothetical protein
MKTDTRKDTTTTKEIYQYYCVSSVGPSYGGAVNPVGASPDKWRMYPHERVQSESGNQVALKLYDGNVDIRGLGLANNASSIETTLPLSILPFDAERSGDIAVGDYYGTQAAVIITLNAAKTSGMTNKLYFYTNDENRINIMFNCKARWAEPI